MLANIWVTNYCNMSCTYCYVDEKGTADMTEETKKQILDFIEYRVKLQNPKYLAVNFHGGEPLLKYDLIKSLVEEFQRRMRDHHKHCSFIITTNGTLLTKEVVDFLKRNGFSISVSLDGLSDIHNRHRRLKGGQESWGLIESNLQYALQEIPQIFARSTYNPDTVEYLSESVSKLVEMGFRYIKPIPDFFDPRWNRDSQKVLEDEMYKVYEQYKKEYVRKNIEIMFLEEKLKVKPKGFCDGGYSELCISPTGDVYPCVFAVQDQQFKLGNVSRPFEVDIPRHAELCLEHLTCRNCQHFQVCDSKRCIYVNYLMSGTLDTPNNFYCFYQNLTFRLAGLINQEMRKGGASRC